MKKMLLATALALLITGCNRRLLFKNKPAAVAPKETITHHFFVSGIKGKETVDAAKICGGAENVVKTETQQTFVNGCRFYYLGIYTPLEARVSLAGYELPIDMGNSICTAHTYTSFLPCIF